jgi:hypothetical protein
MLTFNLLLTEAGLDPKDVYLVRHKDTRIAAGRLQARGSSPYALWLNRREDFETYQQLQSEECFRKREWIASFVVPPNNETLFAGIYRKIGCGNLPDQLTECPSTGKTVNSETHVFYDLACDHRLDVWVGRLVVEWGEGYRAWIQNADSKDSGNKPILELRKAGHEPPFPGYRDFHEHIKDIPSIPPTWQSHLKNCKGIYLLTCKDHGKIYVGKADGNEGFWGRFNEYAESGHGGNQGLKVHQTSGYMVTILEVLATPEPGELDRLEALWKKKLGSREWGLNKN